MGVVWTGVTRRRKDGSAKRRGGRKGGREGGRKGGQVHTLRYNFNQATALVSKWLVGSSRRSMSGSCSMAWAKASFIRQPPEREERGAI